MIAGALLDTLAVNSMTIAFQSDSSGFVSLVSYVNILYGFLGDRIIFKEQFHWMDLVAAVIILIVTVSTSVYKLREKKRLRSLSQNDSFLSVDSKIEATPISSSKLIN